MSGHVVQILSSVEVYDIERNIWKFTRELPEPTKDGSVAVIENRLFHFGGYMKGKKNLDGEVEDKEVHDIYEYVPHPRDFSENRDIMKDPWLSDWAKATINHEYKEASPILIPYILF